VFRPYGGCFAVKKVVGSRFIIVSGDLSFRTIQDFLAEFYHPNHNKGESMCSNNPIYHKIIVDLVYSSVIIYSVCMVMLHRYASISSSSGNNGTVQTLVSSLDSLFESLFSSRERVS